MTRAGRHTAASGAGLVLGVALLAGCGSAHPARPAGDIAAAAPPAAGVPHAAPVTTAPTSRSTAPPDATGQYASQAAVPATAPAADAAAEAPGVDYQDPLAVARAYLTVRWTYRYTDPASYTTALCAPQLSTPAFAARSAPDPAALAQLRTARESSSATVLSAGYSGEAPSTATTSYVTAQFARTATYRGTASGTTEDHIWSLRLHRTPASGWRVDGVVVAD